MSVVQPFGKRGYQGQYHSQSDRHSKVACWGVLFDLLETCPLLRDHVIESKVVFGVNHEMRDFKRQRKKDLDLVVAQPATPTGQTDAMTFEQLGEHFGVVLTDDDVAALHALPPIVQGPVGSVLAALEAKACMTAHSKSLPRLYDELYSSQETVRGAADQAIAVGLAVINAADEFLSPGFNPLGMASEELVMSRHRQPMDTEITDAKIRQLPRRNRPGDDGFDAIGIVDIVCMNDGSPVSIVMDGPAPKASDDYHYDQMVRRIASTYAYRFSAL